MKVSRFEREGLKATTVRRIAGGIAALVALVLAVALSTSGSAAEQSFDLVIRNGRVVDGTGNPWFDADVAIRGAKIAAVGKLDGVQAARVIDARGLVVSPGFFDIHNHSDQTIVEDGDAQSMVRQGVTSMILGEGSSAAPSDRYRDFPSYFAELRRRGISTNIGSFLGTDRVWIAVHGPRPGPASPPEIDAMRSAVRTAMREGALGVAASLSGPPGNWIDTESLVAMCRVAAESGGVFSIHMRTEGSGVFKALDEAIEIGRRARIPVDILHLKIADRAHWGRMPELAAKIEAARASGLEVTANVYPYRAGQNNLSSIIPPWAHEGGVQAMLARLADPAFRPRLAQEILHGIPGSDWYNHYTATGGWEGMLVVSFSNPEYKRFEGKRMSEVITALGKEPLDVLLELLQKNSGSVPTIYFHHSEEDMRHALSRSFVSVGSDGTAVKTDGPLSAGHPHPRYYGTFPRVLARYVREAGVLSLEEAIRKMTSANAAKVRIYDRGLLRSGMWADVAVFDPATVADRATFDNPHQYAVGIRYVVVNGVLVLDEGRHTGKRPGAVLTSTTAPAGPELKKIAEIDMGNSVLSTPVPANGQASEAVRVLGGRQGRANPLERGVCARAGPALAAVSPGCAGAGGLDREAWLDRCGSKRREFLDEFAPLHFR